MNRARFVAFVTVFQRRIVGCRTSASMRTELAFDAREQAPYDRDVGASLAHYNDRGSQSGHSVGRTAPAVGIELLGQPR